MKKKIILIIVCIILIVACIVGAIIWVNTHRSLDSKKEILKEKIETAEKVTGIQVFFEFGLEEEKINEIKEHIESNDSVMYTYRITKEDAFNNIKEKFKGHEDVINSYGVEIFPDSLIIYVERKAGTKKIKSFLEEIEGIDDIRIGEIHVELDEIKDRVDGMSEKEVDRLLKFLK